MFELVEKLALEKKLIALSMFFDSFFILVIYCFSLQLRFTTSKTGVNTNKEKLFLRAISRLAERLKAWDFKKLESNTKISKLDGKTTSRSVASLEIILWQQWSKISKT